MRIFLNDIIAYFGAVLTESTKRIFTLFDVLGIVTFFLPELTTQLEDNEPLVRFIGGSVFLLSFIAANFLTYKDLLSRLRKRPADIEIRQRSTEWGISGSRPPMPLSPFTCRLCLDIRNNGDEQGILTSISVRRIETGTTLLANRPMSIEWKRESENPYQANTDVKFPLTASPKFWDARLVGLVKIEFSENNIENLVKRLNEFKDFLIELCYEYDTFGGEHHQKSLLIQGSLGDLRKHILQDWVSQKRHDLVYMALDVESLVENQK